MSVARDREPVATKDIVDIINMFPGGSLVSIEWISRQEHFDPDMRGIELDEPEAAVLLDPIPEMAFTSFEGRWVVPFQCVHQGRVCVTTSFRLKRLDN